jgi:LmbE family N-acetylglucosaminyl deacetylase
MNDNLAEKIIERKNSCVFVSPHLDDAVLSCGNLMMYLNGKTDMSVLTVFTEAGGVPETLSARMFLKQCGVPNAHELFEKRREEDERVLDAIGASRKHLGFADALWRKRTGLLPRMLGRIFPEFAHVYPTYRFHITKGRVSEEEQNLMDRIKVDIDAIAAGRKDTVLFFPLGLGKHVDHVITHLVGMRFPAERTVFYADFPYCLTDKPDEAHLAKRGLRRIESDADPKEKHPLIAMYATQHLFEGDIPETPEVYYVPENLLQ